MSFTTKIMAIAMVLLAVASQGAVAAPDAGFTAFIASLWPEREALMPEPGGHRPAADAFATRKNCSRVG